MLTGALTNATGSGLSLGWADEAGSRRLLGTFDPQPGGLGVLGLGPVAAAAAAALLARRDRLALALALAACSALFLLAVLTVRYGSAPYDVVRFDGHARTFALLALMVALGARLHDLRPRWRYAAGALVAALVIWPTAAAPVRNLGLAVGHGTQLANARPGQLEFGVGPMDRYALPPFTSAAVAAFIRDRTPVDARVLSPSPNAMSIATGRANARGFVGRLHQEQNEGPAHRDALHYLEPAAVRRLGIAYVHATEAWVTELPDRAARWLADPGLFDLLVHDGGEALYRVRPEFLELDAAPTPAAFEALRQAVPASASVYVYADFIDPQHPAQTSVGFLRAAAAVSHARLLGANDLALLHTRPPFQVEPLGSHVPDLVLAPPWFLPWMFPPDGRRPIWWNDEAYVYAPRGGVDPIMPPPTDTALAVSLRLTDVRVADGRVSFTATLDDQDPERWTSQDWLAIAVHDGLPWGMPDEVDGADYFRGSHWYDSQISAGEGTVTNTYEFDARAPRLRFRDGHGAFVTAASSGGMQGPGVWVLGMRLRHEWRAGSWRDVAFVPALNFRVSESGAVSYQVYGEAPSARAAA